MVIKGVGKVNGQLKLPRLGIFLAETRRLSEFDLRCDQLRALRISWGARPNFTCNANRLTRLSIGLLVASGDILGYLVRLLKGCPKLTTVGSENLATLKFALSEVNAGKFSLPLLRALHIEWPQYLQNLDGEFINLLAGQEERVKPDHLRIVFNGQPLGLQQLTPIVRLHENFTPDSHNERVDLERKKLGNLYFDFLSENPALASLDFLFSGIKKMSFEQNGRIELDEALVERLRNLEGFWTYQKSPRIGEELFTRMLRTWTKLRFLYLEHPSELIGQEVAAHFHMF